MNMPDLTQFTVFAVWDRHHSQEHGLLYYDKKEVDTFIKGTIVLEIYNKELREQVHLRNGRIEKLEQEIAKLKGSQSIKDPVRAAFEEWLAKDGLYSSVTSYTQFGIYRSLETQARWECWKAATTAALAPG